LVIHFQTIITFTEFSKEKERGGMGITGYIKKSSFVWKIHQPTTTTAETKKHISDFVESTFKNFDRKNIHNQPS
jgi:hypothetical protein